MEAGADIGRLRHQDGRDVLALLPGELGCRDGCGALALLLGELGRRDGRDVLVLLLCALDVQHRCCPRAWPRTSRGGRHPGSEPATAAGI